MSIGGKAVVAAAIQHQGVTIMGATHYDENMRAQFKAVFGTLLTPQTPDIQIGYVLNRYQGEGVEFFVPSMVGLQTLYAPVRSDARRKDRELRRTLYTMDQFYGETTGQHMVRFVVCAANKFDDLIVVGYRHYCPIMNQLIDALPSSYQATQNKCKRENQGFIDNTGQFLTREEAYHLAISVGQITEESKVAPTKNKLFSEDLY